MDVDFGNPSVESIFDGSGECLEAFCYIPIRKEN